MANPTPQILEAVLFFKGGTVSIKELASMLSIDEGGVLALVEILKSSLAGRGLTIIMEGGKVGLGTAPEATDIIEKIRKEELEGPLGKAGLETLSVIIYRGPLSRTDIEYVRGVNCTSILRSLLIRGLIERVENPTDKRSFLYRATPELPAYLGVSSLSELPEYAEIKSSIEKIFEERELALKSETDTVLHE